MGTIKVTYNGDMTTTAISGNSPIVLHTDGSTQSRTDGTSFTPTDMLVSSLGACMLTMMGFMAAKNGVSIDGATASLSYTQDKTTHGLESISVRFGFKNIALSERDKKILAASIRSCPVGASLNPAIKRVFEFDY